MPHPGELHIIIDFQNSTKTQREGRRTTRAPSQSHHSIISLHITFCPDDEARLTEGLTAVLPLGAASLSRLTGSDGLGKGVTLNDYP